jgi:hypothetical protein
MRRWFFQSILGVNNGIPSSPKIITMTKSTIKATMPMAIALSQPQSKKCFIRAPQMNNTIKPAMKPTIKIPSKSAIIVLRQQSTESAKVV